jgi:hypothetical protein
MGSGLAIQIITAARPRARLLIPLFPLPERVNDVKTLAVGMLCRTSYVGVAIG